MSTGSLARRYAKALMEIGTEEQCYERIGQDVATLAAAINDSKELSDILSNPVFPMSERNKIVVAVLNRIGASKTVSNFAKLVLERERTEILPDISRELSAMIDERSGQVTAEVSTAAPLSAVHQRQLILALESLSGKKVQLSIEEDPTLLGGLVAKVGDLVYDGSIRTQLQELGRSLS